jgi:hypothetical protein
VSIPDDLGALLRQARAAERWRCHELAMIALRARRPELTAGLIAANLDADAAIAQLGELPPVPPSLDAATHLPDAREVFLHAGQPLALPGDD